MVSLGLIKYDKAGMARFVYSLVVISAWQFAALSAMAMPCAATAKTSEACCCCGDADKCGCCEHKKSNENPLPRSNGVQLCTCGSQGDPLPIQLRPQLECPRELVGISTVGDPGVHSTRIVFSEMLAQVGSPPRDFSYLETFILLI